MTYKAGARVGKHQNNQQQQCVICKEHTHWKTRKWPIKACACVDTRYHAACLKEWQLTGQSRYCRLCCKQYTDFVSKEEITSVLLAAAVVMLLVSVMCAMTSPTRHFVFECVQESVKLVLPNSSTQHSHLVNCLAWLVSVLLCFLALSVWGCLKALASGAWVFLLAREVYDRCPWT